LMRCRMKFMLGLLSFFIISGMALAKDSSKVPPPARVVVATVKSKIVAEDIPIVGTLYFDRVSRVSTEVPGLVLSIRPREGDLVKEGDILARLNTDFIVKDIGLAMTRIEQLEVQIERAEKDIRRYEALYHENAAAEKAYDDLAFSRRELLKQKDALLKGLEIALLKKRKSTIVAPFDGIVLEKCAETGDWVSQGAVFCRLGSLEDLCVKVPVAEKLMSFSGKGQKVKVTLDALGKTVEGTVGGLHPVADLKTKNVMLKVFLPRLPMVVENMSATVRVPTSRPKKLALVPRDALVNIKGREFVYMVKEGKAVPVPIKVYAFVGEYAGVDSPKFSKGMLVVVDGGERLRSGQRVEVIEENPGAERSLPGPEKKKQ